VKAFREASSPAEILHLYLNPDLGIFLNPDPDNTVVFSLVTKILIFFSFTHSYKFRIIRPSKRTSNLLEKPPVLPRTPRLEPILKDYYGSEELSSHATVIVVPARLFSFDDNFFTIEHCRSVVLRTMLMADMREGNTGRIEMQVRIDNRKKFKI
jgi:hypothetical protein